MTKPTEINVNSEMWMAAHALELKAFQAGDAEAMGNAADLKGQLALRIFTEKPEPQEGFKAGNGVKDSLAGVVPTLRDVGVVDSE